MEHGKQSTYLVHKCRCDECKAVMSEYRRARKKKGLAPDDPRHGTMNGYGNFGCRCEPCKHARGVAMGTRTLDPEDERHGTTEGYYTHKCKCDRCRDAARGTMKRNSQLKFFYGLTIPEWEQLWRDQGKACAGCLKACEGPTDPTFVVDHDHATGEVRGILCRGCNQALGVARDSPETLRRLADYLEVPPFFRF